MGDGENGASSEDPLVDTLLDAFRKEREDTIALNTAIEEKDDSSMGPGLESDVRGPDPEESTQQTVDQGSNSELSENISESSFQIDEGAPAVDDVPRPVASAVDDADFDAVPTEAPQHEVDEVQEPHALATSESQLADVKQGVVGPLTLQSMKLAPNQVFMVERGSAIGRRISAAVLGLALLGLVATSVLREANQAVGMMPVLLFILAILALPAMVAFQFYPLESKVQTAMASDQQQELARATATGETLSTRIRVASVAVFVGLAAAAIQPMLGAIWWPGVGLGLIVALVALGVLLTSISKRDAVKRLYMQTLLLAHLEAHGVSGATDGRVAPVLSALDNLLGKLPDDVVAKFLNTDAANLYLQLIEELNE